MKGCLQGRIRLQRQAITSSPCADACVYHTVVDNAHRATSRAGTHK